MTVPENAFSDKIDLKRGSTATDGESAVSPPQQLNEWMPLAARSPQTQDSLLQHGDRVF